MKKLFILFLIINCTLLIDNCFSQWVQISNGMGNLTVSALSVEGNNLFAGGTSSGVYGSTNGGNSWYQTSLNNQLVFSVINRTNNVIAGTFNAGSFYSTNNGANWTQVTMGGNMTVWALAYSGSNLYAGTFCPIIANMGVYLSTNNGASWSHIGVTNREVRSLAAEGNNIYAGTIDSGVFISSNSGVSWIKSSLNNKNVKSMVVNGSNVFAGCLNSVGVYRSTDYGTTWIQSALNNRDGNAMSINGVNIFTGTSGYGVYVSNDNGISWVQKNEGLGSLFISSLFINNGYIYAGTNNNSVYKRPLNELLAIQTISNVVPDHFTLSQNYPNPFNPVTIINFQVSKTNLVTIVVYDLLGREVSKLVNEQLNPGTYEVDFDGTNYTSGIYYYKIQAEDYTETRKMVLVK